MSGDARVLALDMDAGLVTNSDDDQAISLEGALYAKAWSIHSAAVGYGFDVVWSTGDITELYCKCTGGLHGLGQRRQFVHQV